MADYRKALIVGAGMGLSAALARLFARNGLAVALAARQADRLAPLCEELGAAAFACDATSADAVAALFGRLDAEGGAPDIVVYNVSGRLRGPIASLEPAAVHDAIMASAFGGFLVAREAAIRMEQAGRGAIFFTGASASVKGFAGSAPFAMGKFALRGLAQSLARELQPKNIHVAHFVIDGGIQSARRPAPPPDAPDSLLLPDAIAETYWAVLNQHRSAWSWEIELRPWTEKF